MYLKENGNPARGKHWSIFIKQFDFEELNRKNDIYIHTVKKVCVPFEHAFCYSTYINSLIFSYFILTI